MSLLLEANRGFESGRKIKAGRYMPTRDFRLFRCMFIGLMALL